jgi:hypothetical protein
VKLEQERFPSFTSAFPQIVLDLGCPSHVGNQADVTVGADQEERAGCDAVDVPDVIVAGNQLVFP